jgi:hypothetical protein
VAVEDSQVSLGSRFLPLTILSCSELNLIAATNSMNANAFVQALMYADNGIYLHTLQE